MVLSNKTTISLDDFLIALTEAIEAVKSRGKAELNEATMLDAMIPSLDAMKLAQKDGLSAKDVLAKGVEASYQGVEHTKTLVATKGRASYLGERGIGHQDPGATSYTYILEAIMESL